MQNKFLFFISLILLVILSVSFASATAETNCHIYNRTDVPVGFVSVMNLFSLDGGHAEFGNLTNYDFTVACDSSIANLNIGCSNTYANVVQLYQPTDAHVSTNDYYSNKICVNTETANREILMQTSATGTVPADYDCMFAIAALQDSHVYACDHPDADYNVNLRVRDTSEVTGTPPTWDEFDVESSTDFYSITDYTNVTNITLGKNSVGAVKFQGSKSASAMNYNSAIEIGANFISVDPALLDLTYNTTSTITFNNQDCTSFTNDKLIYAPGSYSTIAGIQSNGYSCPPDICSNIQCVGFTLTFTAAHFSGFAVGGNVNLSFDNNGPKNTTEILTFTAHYINATSGAHIAAASCNLTLYNGTLYTMAEIPASHYEQNITHSTQGTFDYNITCGKTNYTTLSDTDTFTISNGPIAVIPEFSDYAMVLILVIAIGGFLFIKKKQIE